MSKRHHAREVAVQMLYQRDFNADISDDMLRSMIQEQLKEEEIARFCLQLVNGVVSHRAEIDAAIEQVAQNWTVSRMAATDRNVLRLGAFELIHTETPPRVVIDEALELAKAFGARNSSGFVNGILDRLIPDSKRNPSAEKA